MIIPILNERYDSSELVALFNKYKNKGLSPIWVDPYCQFVCNISNTPYKFTQINNGKLHKDIISI